MYTSLVEVSRSGWEGQIVGIRSTAAVDMPTILTPLQPSPCGGSGTFLAADNSNNRWWIKPLNNLQGARVTVTEAIVGAAGRLIGAPVCETRIVVLPEELRGWEFRPGSFLEPGLAHASRDVRRVFELRTLQHRVDDDNQRRHAGVFALYDWCWGGDDQWLYAQSLKNCLFSHDHGWYLPEVGPTWDEASLMRRVDEPHLPAWPTDGLDQEELVNLAHRLRNLTTEQLAFTLGSIPNNWPVTDVELECVGWFLERRSQAVASRLEVLTNGDGT